MGQRGIDAPLLGDADSDEVEVVGDGPAAIAIRKKTAQIELRLLRSVQRREGRRAPDIVVDAHARDGEVGDDFGAQRRLCRINRPERPLYPYREQGRVVCRREYAVRLIARTDY